VCLDYVTEILKASVPRRKGPFAVWAAVNVHQTGLDAGDGDRVVSLLGKQTHPWP
jgi:hypothetical protein